MPSLKNASQTSVETDVAMQTPQLIHTAFDLLASISALAMTLFVYKWRLKDAGDRIGQIGAGYLIVFVAGAVVGGFGFGTLNLYISGIPGIGRSIVGAFFGAVVFVELYKRAKSIKGSTGLIFVPAFATSVTIGRFGCFLSGLNDQTYGVPTNLPWAVDLGDGVLRHPVQIYESVSMAVFLALTLFMLARRQPFFIRNGFYLLAIWYGSQRFVWEFFMTYGTIISSLNVFHFVCSGLIVYGLWMIFHGQTRGPVNLTAK